MLPLAVLFTKAAPLNFSQNTSYVLTVRGAQNMICIDMRETHFKFYRDRFPRPTRSNADQMEYAQAVVAERRQSGRHHG